MGDKLGCCRLAICTCCFLCERFYNARKPSSTSYHFKWVAFARTIMGWCIGMPGTTKNLQIDKVKFIKAPRRWYFQGQDKSYHLLPRPDGQPYVKMAGRNAAFTQSKYHFIHMLTTPIIKSNALTIQAQQLLSLPTLYIQMGGCSGTYIKITFLSEKLIACYITDNRECLHPCKNKLKSANKNSL